MSKFKHSTTRSPVTERHSPPVGDYTATATSVAFDPEYFDDDMIVVEYTLEADSGETFTFTERFPNIDTCERTVAFDNYLQENGIANGIDGIVGHVERVQLRKQIVRGRTYVNITHRDFVA